MNIEERDANFHKLWLEHILHTMKLLMRRKFKRMSENIQISKNLFMWCYLIIVENNEDENLKKITSKELEKNLTL